MMRSFEIQIPIEFNSEGLSEIEGITLALTEDDVSDLESGYSITTLTTQAEEVKLYPVEHYTS